MSFLAFESINLPLIAEINNGHIIRYLNIPSNGRVQFYDSINPNVFLLKLTPSMSPDLIPEIFSIYDAVVIESFGAGGIPASIENTLLSELSKYRPEEKILAMTTQVTYEGSHINTYAVGRRIADSFKILEARDMTLETIIAKLMWILGNSSQTWDEIEQRFYTPVAMDSVY
jgi:L-asparaginase